MFTKYLNQITILSFVAFSFNFHVEAMGQEQKASQAQLDQFDFISASEGWVLIDHQLFWTSNSGKNWNEIGPPIPAEATVQEVNFTDLDSGWVLWTTSNIDGTSNFTLAHTNNHGKDWSAQQLVLFQPDETIPFSKKTSMGWFDSQNGWIAMKQSSGSNFSLGMLFTTSDGGITWLRSILPVADRVSFDEPKIGWAVGGPKGDQIFKTMDGGHTWLRTEPEYPSNINSEAYVPRYDNGRSILPMLSKGKESELDLFYSHDRIGHWLLIDRVPLNNAPGVIPISILDSQNLVAIIPGSNSIVRLNNLEVELLKNTDGLSSSIVDLEMISLRIGWAKSVEANCVTASSLEDGTDSVSCSSLTRLLHTENGGLTWSDVNLPSATGVQTKIYARQFDISATYALPNTGNTEIFIGQGFDKCEIPSLEQMQTWWNSAPYKTVNLYIGGLSRACANNALTASYVEQLYIQGWKFIPTWVGPQAPCTGYQFRMSDDVATAFDEGVAEANLAVERLAELGLTYLDKTGSVVYYDIEYYGTNTACRDVVNSFMNGWVSQIHAHGNLAGAYGSTLCNTSLSDFINLENQLDVIWPARWYHNLGTGLYDPTASVWDLGSCLPNTEWSDHQRIRQYEGDHDETWGELTLNVDSNVLDGVVAIPYVSPVVKSIKRADINPTNVDIVNFTVTFTEPVTGLDMSDLTLTVTDLVGVSAISLSGTDDVYTLTVDSGSGNGTIRLDLKDDDTIIDVDDLPLGGIGAGNGDFSSGESYLIIKNPIFDDVQAVYWAWEYVERLYNAGITGGCSTSPLNYCPENQVTRAQMAVFLEKGLHYPALFTAPDMVPTFNDTIGHWAEDWIEALKNDGVTAGCAEGLYCPENPVTRAQMAVFLLKSKYGSLYIPPDIETDTGFGDVPVDHWAAAWIKQLAAEGITGGCGGGNYCPDAPVTRAQMAVFLVKAFGLP